MLVFRTRQIAVRCTLRRGIWPDGAFGGPRCECGGRATSISANEPRSATDDVATSDSTNSRLETRVLQCPEESCGNPSGHTVLGFRPGALLLRAQTWIFFVGQIHCCEYFTLDVRKTCTGVATSSDPGSTDVASRRPDPVAPTAAPHGRLPSFGRCTLGSLASRTVCLHRSARRQRRGRWRCEHPRMLHAAATPMCAPNMHRQNICMQVRLCSALMADGAVILGGCWFSA